jgi:hypothetical protein
MSRSQLAARSRIAVDMVTGNDNVEVFRVSVYGLWIDRLKLGARTAQTTVGQFIEDAITSELVYRMMSAEQRGRVKVTPEELRELAHRLETADEDAQRKLSPRDLRIARGDDFRDICKR